MKIMPTSIRRSIIFFLLLLVCESCEVMRFLDWLTGSDDCPAQCGPHEVANKVIDIPVLDDTNPSAVFVFPEQIEEDDNTEVFTLVVFLHGLYGGNWKTYLGYKALLDGVASHGFIVAAVRSCDTGCSGGSWEWENYHREALNLITWVSDRKQQDDGVLKFVDNDAGYGVFGHSMGGGATLDALAVAEEYDIRAGILLHTASTATNASIATTVNVPLAVYTGTRDRCCGNETSRPVYDNTIHAPKAYADMVGAGHTEPNLFRTGWSLYSAAWFKLYLGNGTDNNDDTLYYNDIIYGNEEGSLCGDCIPMADNCEALETTKSE